MIDENIMKFIEKVREIWLEELYPKLAIESDVDKELLSEVTDELRKGLPTDFFRLNDIYLLIGDIKSIVNGHATLVRGLNIEQLLDNIKCSLKSNRGNYDECH